MKKATLIITAILLVVMATSSFAIPPQSARQIEPGVRLDFLQEQPVGNPCFSDYVIPEPGCLILKNEVHKGASEIQLDFLLLDEGPVSVIQVDPYINLDIEDLMNERSKILKRAYTNKK